MISIMLTVCGGFLAGMKFLFLQFSQRLDKKFEVIEADAKQWLVLERSFLEFKASIPVDYVRREDYVRNQTIIESKLDAVALKLENWQLKEASKP